MAKYTGYGMVGGKGKMWDVDLSSQDNAKTRAWRRLTDKDMPYDKRQKIYASLKAVSVLITIVEKKVEKPKAVTKKPEAKKPVLTSVKTPVKKTKKPAVKKVSKEVPKAKTKAKPKTKAKKK